MEEGAAPSGIRMGTPSIAFRGMKEKESKQIAGWIARVLAKEESTEKIKEEVRELCRNFPLSYA